MAYNPEVKEQVRDQYQDGVPRRKIAETMSLPLSTVCSWTQDIVSAEATQMKCVVCGKQKRTLNIRQVYCSESCKNRANYQRRRCREVAAVPSTRICEHCGTKYQHRHGNALKYCSKECRNKASVGRLKRIRNQSQVWSEKVEFQECLEILFQARRDATDLKIDGEKYRSELDIIAEYFAEHKASISQVVFYRVQEIFQSVKYRKGLVEPLL